MANKNIQLKDASANLLFPRTYWDLVLDKPSLVSPEQLALKQDKLTSENAGTGISIGYDSGNVLKISAATFNNYQTLLNKPSINGIELTGALTSSQLNIPAINNTNQAFEIADANGNVVLQITNAGHIITKEFNSAEISPATISYINSQGFITADYHDPTKQDVSSLISTIQAAKFVQYNTSGNNFNILGSDHATTLLTIATDTGALITQSFNSANVLSRLTSIETNMLTRSNLGAALSVGNYNISYFNNNAGYITSAYHDPTKQDLLSSANAGQNVTITIVGGVPKINATGGGGGGGTTDYNALSNRPYINSVLLEGNVTLAALGVPGLVTNAGSNNVFDVTDSDGNVILRLNNGHIQTRYFDSATDVVSYGRPPLTDGTYMLAAIVSNGIITYQWQRVPDHYFIQANNQNLSLLKV